MNTTRDLKDSSTETSSAVISIIQRDHTERDIVQTDDGLVAAHVQKQQDQEGQISKTINPMLCSQQNVVDSVEEPSSISSNVDKSVQATQTSQRKSSTAKVSMKAKLVVDASSETETASKLDSFTKPLEQAATTESPSNSLTVAEKDSKICGISDIQESSKFMDKQDKTPNATAAKILVKKSTETASNVSKMQGEDVMMESTQAHEPNQASSLKLKSSTTKTLVKDSTENVSKEAGFSPGVEKVDDLKTNKPNKDSVKRKKVKPHATERAQLVSVNQGVNEDNESPTLIADNSDQSKIAKLREENKTKMETAVKVATTYGEDIPTETTSTKESKSDSSQSITSCITKAEAIETALNFPNVTGINISTLTSQESEQKLQVESKKPKIVEEVKSKLKTVVRKGTECGQDVPVEVTSVHKDSASFETNSASKISEKDVGEKAEGTPKLIGYYPESECVQAFSEKSMIKESVPVKKVKSSSEKVHYIPVDQGFNADEETPANYSEKFQAESKKPKILDEEKTKLETAVGLGRQYGEDIPTETSIEHRAETRPIAESATKKSEKLGAEKAQQVANLAGFNPEAESVQIFSEKSVKKESVPVMKVRSLSSERAHFVSVDQGVNAEEEMPIHFKDKSEVQAKKPKIVKEISSKKDQIAFSGTPLNFSPKEEISENLSENLPNPKIPLASKTENTTQEQVVKSSSILGENILEEEFLPNIHDKIPHLETASNVFPSIETKPKVERMTSTQGIDFPEDKEEILLIEDVTPTANVSTNVVKCNKDQHSNNAVTKGQSSIKQETVSPADFSPPVKRSSTSSTVRSLSSERAKFEPVILGINEGVMPEEFSGKFSAKLSNASLSLEKKKIQDKPIYETQQIGLEPTATQTEELKLEETKKINLSSIPLPKPEGNNVILQSSSMGKNVIEAEMKSIDIEPQTLGKANLKKESNNKNLAKKNPLNVGVSTQAKKENELADFVSKQDKAVEKKVYKTTDLAKNNEISMATLSNDETTTSFDHSVPSIEKIAKQDRSRSDSNERAIKKTKIIGYNSISSGTKDLPPEAKPKEEAALILKESEPIIATKMSSSQGLHVNEDSAECVNTEQTDVSHANELSEANQPKKRASSIGRTLGFNQPEEAVADSSSVSYKQQAAILKSQSSEMALASCMEKSFGVGFI